MSNEICGLTTEGNKVWDLGNGFYKIEGRYEGQYWTRKYKDCYSWIKFFKPIKREDHRRYMLTASLEALLCN